MPRSVQADGLLFYAMPCVEGESPHEQVVREKQLPSNDALQIAREVADALGSSDSNGVTADIKPVNIMLEEGHAVVADFGIASPTDAGVARRQRPMRRLSASFGRGRPAPRSPS
jgi:serine/threonine protein kinase